MGSEAPPDIEIAQHASMLPIAEVAAKLGIATAEIDPYGSTKAKISSELVARSAAKPHGKLVLVTAISPTPAGEGKTTTSIGLADAMARRGEKVAVCLREPSLGPCFGMKGGASGGGYAQVVPMEDINLHFTGDMHAIGAAHNLLAATLDNHLHHGNALGLDSRRISWPRVVDMNDRALRHIAVGMGGVSDGVPRESRFDITVASEVMAIFCLAESLAELKDRLGEIVVGETRKRVPIRARDLKVHGAMAALLKEAIRPNLVQTLENTPAFVHGGPFANIAHGCNSVLATKLSMGLAEYTVTEAGFGADLGAEKFLNIKCRKSSLKPDAVVLVATIRALKYHGGVDLKELTEPDPAAVERGCENLMRHIQNLQSFGLPVLVAVNWFQHDTEHELAVLRAVCDPCAVPVIKSEHHRHGGAGARALADEVVAVCQAPAPALQLSYEDSLPLWEKIICVACKIYGAADIHAAPRVRRKIQRYQDGGFGDLPVCMAKTQYSFSTDPARRGSPRAFELPIQDVRLAAGAGFVVVYTGDITTMPGLRKVPAAEEIDIDEQGNICGLF